MAGPLGIICALPEEIEHLHAALTNRDEETVGGFHFAQGRLDGEPVALVESGIGKVASSLAATLPSVPITRPLVALTWILESAYRPSSRLAVRPASCKATRNRWPTGADSAGRGSGSCCLPGLISSRGTHRVEPSNGHHAASRGGAGGQRGMVPHE